MGHPVQGQRLYEMKTHPDPEVRSSEADDDLEVDDDFPFELLEDHDEVYDDFGAR